MCIKVNRVNFVFMLTSHDLMLNKFLLLLWTLKDKVVLHDLCAIDIHPTWLDSKFKIKDFIAIFSLNCL